MSSSVGESAPIHLSRLRPRRPEDYDALYSATPPWEIGRSQPAVAEIASAGGRRAADAGCGTGEHAPMAAALGLEVVGIDSAASAIATARANAEERG